MRDSRYNAYEHRREELPMREDALRSSFWVAVIVVALAIWVVWYMEVWV